MKSARVETNDGAVHHCALSALVAPMMPMTSKGSMGGRFIVEHVDRVNLTSAPPRSWYCAIRAASALRRVGVSLLGSKTMSRRSRHSIRSAASIRNPTQ